VAYAGFNGYLAGMISFSGDIAATNFYMTFTALSKTLIGFSFYKYAVAKDKILGFSVFFFFLISLNELIDELLFDPCSFQVNEVVFLIAGAWHSTRIFYGKI
jgi:hypothetical protein